MPKMSSASADKVQDYGPVEVTKAMQGDPA